MNSTLTIKTREAAFSVADRIGPLRRVGFSALKRRIAAQGGNSAVLDEALDGVDARPSRRTAEMMMWSGAIEGLGRFPQFFPADQLLETPAARAASVEGLKRHPESHPGDPGDLGRLLILLDDESALEDVAGFVAGDLADRLSARAVKPRKRTREIGRTLQVEVLAAVAEALSGAGLRPFLVSGTLLGYVRRGELMAHDYDIDLGTLPGEGTAPEVAEALAPLPGFVVETQELKVVARHDSGFDVDVFIHYARDGLLWHGTEIHEWWNTPFELEPASLHGVDVWVPTPADRYLDENYGTWQRPIAFYNFSFDTPNRTYRNNREALLYLHMRCVRALRKADRWTVESVIRELRDNFGIDLTDHVQPTPLLRRHATDAAPPSDSSSDSTPVDVLRT